MHIRKILSETTLIMLARTTYDISYMQYDISYCCYCSIDFKITDLMVSIMLKSMGSKLNLIDRKSVQCTLRCFTIIVVKENIWIFFVTLLYLFTGLYFLCECFFYTCLPLILLSSPEFGHVNMYLVKINWEKNWHIPCLAEEREISLRWFSSSVN